MFISEDGSMRLIRDNYRTINSVADFKATLRAGSHVWPGGYPLYFIMADGEPMSFYAALTEARLIIEAMLRGDKHDQWRVIGCEDTELFCCHTNQRIESAYGEDC